MDASVMEAAPVLDMGLVRGLITVLTMAVYAGIFWWAYRGGNRERFEADALIPFLDDPAPRDHDGATRHEDGEVQ